MRSTEAPGRRDGAVGVTPDDDALAAAGIARSLDPLLAPPASEAVPPPRTAATQTGRGVRFVLLVVFVDMLAASISIPVIPKLVLSILHGDGASAAGAVGLFGAAFSAMQLLFGPLQGAVSDRFGRRVVLVVSCAGLAASQVTAALAGGIGLLVASRLLAGASAANISAATAYLADVTPPDARAAAFGRIGVAFGAGLVFGPLIGGVVAGAGLRAPFWLAAVLCLGNAVWAAVAIPESLPAGRRRPFALHQANPLGALRFLGSSRTLFGLSVASLLSLLCQQALISVYALSAALRFHWSATMLGIAMATIGVCYALVGGLLVKPVVGRIGERRALVAGIGFGVAGFLMLAFAGTGLVYFLAVPVISLWGLAAPATQGAQSRAVPPDQQGRLQGAATVLAAIAGIVGPGLFGGSFELALGAAGALHFPGLPFLLAALLLSAAIPAALHATRDRP